MRDVSSEWLDRAGVKWVFREDSTPLLKAGIPFIINLDDKGGPGTHWVAARRVENTIYYADPFGTVLGGYPPKVLQDYGLPIIANGRAFQRPETNLCGYYAYRFTKALAKTKPGTKQKEFEDSLLKAIV